MHYPKEVRDITGEFPLLSALFVNEVRPLLNIQTSSELIPVIERMKV
ncbi:hypothetical protein [Candidatus Nitrosocosmicus arcticus]|uniref:Uncharacterized protein n=1 Tax=Candidatus Nitrosocosmicus arcticus TaxID=2035267 RepID=A0A557SSH2_9ARCH|nr:hypothetical protein [Candidatus Nitrosocosmicus arcticus]TVP39550.1 hypothetical protein NARC_140005 [Candidatus Nitrosocosmicus arcticus]